MKQKSPSRFQMIAFLLCAVIWTIRVVLGLFYQEYKTDIFFFSLNVVCAAIWWLNYTLTAKRRRKALHQDEDPGVEE
ncbi:MAG: hypothetical protein E7423_01325 [Ruminococcaceae bacterium]|jgi:hypothetical protein|nr:hypothetical protein [Oscillospiraceae bacterium]